MVPATADPPDQQGTSRPDARLDLDDVQIETPPLIQRTLRVTEGPPRAHPAWRMVGVLLGAVAVGLALLVVAVGVGGAWWYSATRAPVGPPVVPQPEPREAHVAPDREPEPVPVPSPPDPGPGAVAPRPARTVPSTPPPSAPEPPPPATGQVTVTGVRRAWLVTADGETIGIEVGRAVEVPVGEYTVHVDFQYLDDAWTPTDGRNLVRITQKGPTVVSCREDRTTCVVQSPAR